MSEPWSAPASPSSKGGLVTPSEVYQAARVLFQRGRPALLPAVVGLSGVSFLLTTLVQGLSYLQQQNPSNVVLLGAASFFSLLFSLLSYGISTVQVGLSRSARRLLSEGAHSVTDPRSALHKAVARFWPTLGITLIIQLVAVLGMVLFLLPALFTLLMGPTWEITFVILSISAIFSFIPPLVTIYLFAMSAYLVTMETRFSDAFQRSAGLMTTHWLAALSVYGPLSAIVIAGSALLAGLVFVVVGIQAIRQGSFDGWWFSLLSLGLSALGVLTAYPLFCLMQALFITVEAHDENIPLRLDE